MEDNINEYSRRNKKKNKKKRGRGYLWSFLILLLVSACLVIFAYFRLKSTTDTIHEDVTKATIVHTSREKQKLELNRDTPFSILLLGIDTGDKGRVDRGRSDTIMVMTINPRTNETTLLSIPRDTYTEIVGRGFQDKINHAYSYGGAQNAVKALNTNLDLNITEYVTVNFDALIAAVNAMGGITLDIDKSEIGYMNDYIAATSQSSGVKSATR